MTNSEHTVATPGPQVPASLTDRVTDPKRLLQAARAMTVLESDLRSLLEKMPYGDLDAGAVQYAATSYRSLRSVVVDALDEEGRTAANDEAIGMPELGDDPSFSTLLLKLSQATRFVGVEEGWPSMFVSSRSQHRQLGEHFQMLTNTAQNGAMAIPMDLGSPDTAAAYL